MHENTTADHIIAFLGSARSTRIYYRILRERAFARRKKRTLQTTLYRLSKKGIIEREGDGWRLTDAGYKTKLRNERFGFIKSPFKKGSVDSCIVSFDIPGGMRFERDWLRSQLKMFGYHMVQQSLWKGPGPLPKEFTQRLTVLSIKSCVKVFQLT